MLISNDDGIHAMGMRTLVAELADAGFDVTVVAPDRERSATGHALTLHQPLRAETLKLGDSTAYAISGTPSDCIKIAMNSLLDFQPDFLISGINHGPNLGNDIIYSGTVSAAMEGAIHGLPSMAVSLFNGHRPNADFAIGARFIKQFLPTAHSLKLPNNTILNVNLPAGDIQGVRMTTLSHRQYNNTYERRLDPRNQVYYWLAGELVEGEDVEGTDTWAVLSQLASVTPVRLDMTHYDFARQHGPLLDGWQP